MASPVWITPPGSLGTLPQGVFYEIPLVAYEPDRNETVYYEVIAGQLPPGIQVDSKGVMAGVPKISSNQFNVESQFAVRAYTKRSVNGKPTLEKLSDRTFTLTITGQAPPEFITPPGLVAQFYDGTKIADPGVRIEYTDFTTSYVRIIGGALPSNLKIDPKGLITGYVDETTSDITYTFILEVYGPNGSNVRTFSVDVYNRATLTADNTYVTADNTFITADVGAYTPPIMVTPPGSIGRVPGDTFFAFQFQGADFNDQPLAFEFWQPNYNLFNPILLGNGGVKYTNTIPPGLTLDPVSGWMMGYLPKAEQSFDTYTFQVYCYETENTEYTSSPEWYSLTIIGEPSSQVEWLTPSYLGCIENGATSIFYVKAQRLGIGRLGYGVAYSTAPYDNETYDNLPIRYHLKEGSYSLLPQGLKLLPSGLISGRASFDTFALDGGKTVFDIEPNIDPVFGQCGPCDCKECGNDCGGCAACNVCPGVTCSETTFDMVFRFVVNVTSPDGEVNVDRECSILLKRTYNEPYENLYIEAMPPIDDRIAIDDLLYDREIFRPDMIYRLDDPFFGVAKNVMYWHAFGLTSSTRERYVEAMEFNHYWKNLTLGEIKTAQAVDDSGNILYEVVYSQVVDDLVNNEGVTVGKAVILPYPIPLQDFDRRADTTVVTADTEFVTADCAPYANPLDAVPGETIIVYPNGIEDMREQIIDRVGQVSDMLPRWMLSPQANGQVLGFTPAWVLAYAKPGFAKHIAYNLQTKLKRPLNLIDFEADRYELDHTLSIHWDPILKQWVPHPPTDTTFDDEGFNLPLNYIGQVDYATNLAFSDINYRPIEYINALGGLDGPIGESINDKTIIFLKQENYPTKTTESAWSDVLVPFGSSYGTPTYNDSIIVPGEYVHNRDPSIPNERLDIWKMIVLPGNVVKLEIFDQTTTYDTVTVIKGNEYQNDTFYIPAYAGEGQRLITWSPIPTFTKGPTVFDHNSLQFITPVDQYESTDRYNEYLLFPKRNIITNT